MFWLRKKIPIHPLIWRPGEIPTEIDSVIILTWRLLIEGEFKWLEHRGEFTKTSL